jgi:hypothetical protein
MLISGSKAQKNPMTRIMFILMTRGYPPGFRSPDSNNLHGALSMPDLISILVSKRKNIYLGISPMKYRIEIIKIMILVTMFIILSGL